MRKPMTLSNALNVWGERSEGRHPAYSHMISCAANYFQSYLAPATYAYRRIQQQHTIPFIDMMALTHKQLLFKMGPYRVMYTPSPSEQTHSWGKCIYYHGQYHVIHNDKATHMHTTLSYFNSQWAYDEYFPLRAEQRCLHRCEVEFQKLEEAGYFKCLGKHVDDVLVTYLGFYEYRPGTMLPHRVLNKDNAYVWLYDMDAPVGAHGMYQEDL